MSTIKTAQFLRIPVSRIHIMQEFQVRNEHVSQENTNALAESISKNGLQTPVWGLAVKNAEFTSRFPNVPLNEGDKQYVVIAGFTRMQAIKYAIENKSLQPDFLVSFDVKYQFFPSESELLLTSAGENMSRNDMTELDKASVIARLVKLGIKQNEIAARLGLTQAAVSTLNKFELTADVETKSLVQNGAVSFTAAKTAVEAGLNGTQLTEIVTESKVTGAKVTAEKVLAKAGQQSALSWFRKMIPQVKAGNFTIAGNEKKFSAVDMWDTFSEILDNNITITALVNLFDVTNGVKEVKAPKGELIRQPNGAVGFEADDDGEEE